ncbi:MAG: hypothetical protein M1379_00690 [Firmicutes bacterium]|nr:hypothetical protein [Bacillota bacterium]
MKRVAVIAVFAVLLFSTGALAETGRTISTDLYGIFQGVINGQYEQAINESTSVVISGSTYGASYGPLRASVFGVDSSYRWYPAGKGIFVQAGPELGFVRITYTGYDWYGNPVSQTASGSVFGFAGMAGYKLVVSEGITFEPAVGFYTFSGSIAGPGGSVPLSASGAMYRIGAGYSF